MAEVFFRPVMSFGLVHTCHKEYNRHQHSMLNIDLY